MRLIDADRLKLLECEPNTVMNTRDTMRWNMLAVEINRMIDNAPTVDAQPVKHGEWLEEENPWLRIAMGRDLYALGRKKLWECSVCDSYCLNRTNYCPHCGAKMDFEDSEQEERG